MKRRSTKRLQRTFSSSTNHNNSRVTGKCFQYLQEQNNAQHYNEANMFCPNPLLLTVFLPNVILARHRQTTRSLHPTMEVRILSFHLTRSLSKLHTMHSPHCQTQPIKSEHKSFTPKTRDPALKERHRTKVVMRRHHMFDPSLSSHNCAHTYQDLATQLGPCTRNVLSSSARDARHQHRSPGA
jgi:hypothetical protein